VRDPRPRRLRVLQLLAGCRVGGLERVALTLAERLGERFDFRVVAYDDAWGPLRPAFDAAGAPVRALPRRPGVDLRYPLRLARILRREEIDVVHAHNRTAWFYATLASRLAGGVPVVLTSHDRTAPRLGVRPLQRLCARATTRAVAVSDIGRRALLATEGFDPSRVVVVRNGADERRFRDGADRPAARRALRLPEDAEVVGTVARLHPEKNVPLVVRAFAAVAARRPRARLVVAGDGPELGTCEELARDLRVADRTRFLGERADVTGVLSALDVFALGSDSEGLPVALLEAMACGLPVVATDVGAVAEAVADGTTGTLVPPRDPAAMARALESLLADPARREFLGGSGRARFSADLTAARMAEGYGRVYVDALQGAR
jgi:glycosyltransferase involved in cell wall biosynthesis